MKPIIFNAEMVRAILDGRKTQTRRIIKGDHNKVYWNPIVVGKHGGWTNEHGYHVPCPYGKVGDKLWVKENHQIITTWPPVANGIYLADGTAFNKSLTPEEWEKFGKRKYFKYVQCTGRLMYKSLARIFLEITDIRVERVQDITEEDAKAEGVDCDRTHLEDFEKLWDSIHGKDAWKRNDWVWVVEFKRLSNG